MQRGQPGGWRIILQIQRLGILHTNVPWSCRPYQYSNSITCTDSTMAQTEDEGLSTNIWCCDASDVKSWNSPVVPRSEKNSAGWTTQLRTLWPRGAAKKKQQKGKWDIKVRFPSSDEESNESFPDDETACDDGHSIFGARDSFSPWKIFSASEEVLASTAEFFFISHVMEPTGLPSSFFVLCTCWHCCSFFWYWPVFTNMFIRDRS